MQPKLEIDAPPGELYFVTRRFVKAPPALVYEMWTKAEHVVRWMGPSVLEWVVCELDVRVGGEWRWVQRAPDGTEFHFRGTYLEIDPPHRLSSTFAFEDYPAATDTLTLTAVDGGTLITTHTLHPTVESRDAHLSSGMEGGMTEGYARLDALLAGLQAA